MNRRCPLKGVCSPLFQYLLLGAPKALTWACHNPGKLLSWYDSNEVMWALVIAESSWVVRIQGKPLKISDWLRAFNSPWKSDIVLNMHQHCATRNASWERALPQKSPSQYFLGFSLAANKITALPTPWFVWLGWSWFWETFELSFAHCSRPCEVW